MRMLLKVSMPNEPFNTAVRDGSAGAKMGRILEAQRPEAAYFFDDNGQRTGLLVVDLPDASGIPALAEPWFLTFEAKIELKVCMTLPELQAAGLDSIGKKWGK
jgi:hypothetical protein